MTEDFRNNVESVKTNDFHMAQLFKDLKSREKSAATTERITDALNVNVYEQQDAAEFFQKIMNMVNQEMSKVFKGEFEHNTMFKSPGKEHIPVTCHESFYIIPICMETYGMDSAKINMQSCFDSYFKPIKTCEDGQVKCPTCKELVVDTEIKCSIRKLPPVLVVQLERFQLDYYTMKYKKNKSTVEIQFQLSVKDYSEAQHKYDLYAVVKHSGSFLGGHYYAVIKSFEDHQWYEFNDSFVRKIDDLKNPFECNEAYFLLYKKSSDESENASHDPGNQSED
ncbi:ubiquitin carboxyl-terminal hydrolase 9-like [Pimephales promelas]|uniref:ubiquitin carboxyl-terminal hydrolase 9-like n=1 Tax=Pimephales promelas TaxID=90988 RepID=UPI00195559FA|nr:ubiquitin carboxyl-terminal hydrolase 9-like [Pimephales promelas]